MIHSRFLRSAAAAVALTAAAALPAGAETTLKFAHWVPPAHTLTKSTIEPLIAAVAGSPWKSTSVVPMRVKSFS